MKKLFTSLIMLMTLSMAARADLSVGNVTVTSTGNVNPTGLTSGTIKYDASTNKLTLENVTFETSSTYAIRYTGSTKLTVIFKGKNTINATLGGLSCSGPDLEVYGEGIETKVIINSEDPNNGYFTPMSVYAKEMFIHDITLEATGHHYGINGGTAGSTPRQSTLKISNANVKSTISSTTTGDAAMAGFKACTLIGCEPTDGSYYDSAKCGFKAAEGDDFAKAVNIMFVEPYNLWILGKQVTNLNAANFTVEGLTSGTVSYDASTKTLTLDNVTLTAPEGNNNSAIFVGGGAGDVTIKFTGTTTDANLTANGDAITLYSNTTFTGTGNRVFIKSIKGSGIVTEDGINVLVDFPGYFGSQGAEYGFYGDYPDGDVLTLKKKSSDTYGYNFLGKKGSIYYLGKLVLDNMDFYHQDGTSFNTPGCYWDEADHQVEQNGGTLVTTSVGFKSIKEKLPIYICGKQLNRVENGTDVIEVGSPYITAGGAKAVCYDPSTKTLTLNGVNIDVTDAGIPAIMKTSGDLTINFAGTEKQYLKAKTDVIDLSGGTTTFTGGTKDTPVYIESANESGIKTGSGASVTLNTANFVEFKGKKYAYYGCNISGEKLTLKKATGDERAYRFAGEEGIIHNLYSLVLDNMDEWQGYNDYINGCYLKDGELRQNGGTVATGTICYGAIVEALPIYVCGKQLNKVSPNKSYTIYVGSEYITAGGAKAVGYDPSTQTLTLNNATIKDVVNSHAIMFDSGFEGNVVLSGNNNITVKTSNYSGIVNGAVGVSTTFKGNGSLYVKGLFGLMPWGGSMTLTDNVKIEAIGSFLGVGSNNNGTSGETLIVSGNAQLKAGTIGRLNTITLQDGQTIVEPRGASIQKFVNGYGVSVDGSTLAQNVVIMKTEKYPIFVCGDQVNSYNCNDILGDGKVKYDPSTKTLTLDNATINYSDSRAIYIDRNAEVNINVSGTNKIKAEGFYGVRIDSNSKVTFDGNGSIDIQGNDIGLGTWGSGSVTTIQGNVKLNATSVSTARHGIGGENAGASNGSLVIGGNAKVTASRINRVYTLTLNDGQTIVEPAGAEFKDGGVYVGSDLAQNVVIRKLEKYGVLVMGKEVTSDNCTDILGDGKVSFNPDTKTLTLNNAKMSVGKDDEFNCITNYKGLKGLIIDVNGTCELNSASDWSSLNLRMDAIITGSGTLKLTGSGGDLYADDGANIIINNVNIEAEGCLDGGNNASLAIYLTNGKKVSVKSGVIRWKAITFGEGISVTQPAGTTISNGTIVTSTNAVAGNVVIELVTTVKYDLLIAGTQVTSDNAGDILGNGVFRYDVSKNILTVNGDYMGDDQVISSYVDDLTIELAGACTFTAKGRQTIIYAQNGLTFTGGNLTLVSDAPEKNSIGIYVEHGSLNFKDAYVDVTGDGFEYAITGEAEVPLVIENSNITASAHGEGCFKDFASMTLSGCYIDSPRGTVFENEALRDAEGNVIGGSDATETVVIKSGADAVEGIDAVAGQNDIYDVAGRKLGSMSRGINIVRSADGKTRKVLRK